MTHPQQRLPQTDDIEGYAFMYCSHQKQLQESETHHDRHVLDTTYSHVLAFLTLHLFNVPLC